MINLLPLLVAGGVTFSGAGAVAGDNTTPEPLNNVTSAYIPWAPPVGVETGPSETVVVDDNPPVRRGAGHLPGGAAVAEIYHHQDSVSHSGPG